MVQRLWHPVFFIQMNLINRSGRVRLTTMMKKMFTYIRSAVLPPITEVLPGRSRKLMGGPVSFFTRTVPVTVRYTLLIVFFYFLIELAVWAIVELVLLFKIAEIFRVDFLVEAFFSMIGEQIFRIGFYIFIFLMLIHIVRIMGTSLYLHRGDLVIVRRLPFMMQVIRFPTSAIQMISYYQIPGERFLKTGTVELGLQESQKVRIQSIPEVEKVAADLSKSVKQR